MYRYDKSKQAICRRGGTYFLLSGKYVARAEEIDKIEDEEARQMKFQTLYLYLMAIGEVERSDNGA